MKAQVIVRLKEGVLDPQGEAVCHALNSMGFVCQLGKAPLSEISSELLPAILKGRDDSLMLLDQINEKNAKVFDSCSGQIKSRKIKIETLTEWYSGEQPIASLASEEKNSLKSRLRIPNPSAH